MTKILFVCHGNICRSPMAECIFTDMARKRGVSALFAVSSAATSREELGNGVYPPAARKLREKGIALLPHRARQMTAEDYREYDLLVGMEEYNLRNMLRIVRADPEGKLCRLLDFTDAPGDVADPWYSGDFESAYRDIEAGCRALLEHLLKK